MPKSLTIELEKVELNVKFSYDKHYFCTMANQMFLSLGTNPKSSEEIIAMFCGDKTNEIPEDLLEQDNGSMIQFLLGGVYYQKIKEQEETDV